MSITLAVLLQQLYSKDQAKLRELKNPHIQGGLMNHNERIARLHACQKIAFQALMDAGGVIADFCEEQQLPHLAMNLRGHVSEETLDDVTPAQRAATILASLMTFLGAIQATRTATHVFLDGSLAFDGLCKWSFEQYFDGRIFVSVQGTPASMMRHFTGHLNRGTELSIAEGPDTFHTFRHCDLVHQKIGEEQGLILGAGFDNPFETISPSRRPQHLPGAYLGEPGGRIPQRPFPLQRPPIDRWRVSRSLFRASLLRGDPRPTADDIYLEFTRLRNEGHSFEDVRAAFQSIGAHHPIFEDPTTAYRCTCSPITPDVDPHCPVHG